MTTLDGLTNIESQNFIVRSTLDPYDLYLKRGGISSLRVTDSNNILGNLEISNVVASSNVISNFTVSNVIVSPVIKALSTGGGTIDFYGATASNLIGVGNVSSTSISSLNSIPRFSDTTGKLIKTSLGLIDDSGNLIASKISYGNTQIRGNYRNFETTALSTTASSVAMSSDSRVIVYIFDNTTLRVSYDYGYSWNSVTINSSPRQVSISGDGRYIYYYNAAGLYRSIDGATFTTVSSDTTIEHVSVSQSGRVVYVCRNSPSTSNLVSRDYGSSFSTSTIPTMNTAARSVCCRDGQIIHACTDVGLVYFYYSTDYGATFTRNTNVNYTTSASLKGLAASEDGKYVYIAAGSSGTFVSIRNTNYGVGTFSNMVTGTEYRDLKCSSSGRIVIFLRNTVNKPSISTNFGASTVEWAAFPTAITPPTSNFGRNLLAIDGPGENTVVLSSTTLYFNAIEKTSLLVDSNISTNVIVTSNSRFDSNLTVSGNLSGRIDQLYTGNPSIISISGNTSTNGSYVFYPAKKTLSTTDATDTVYSTIEMSPGTTLRAKFEFIAQSSGSVDSVSGIVEAQFSRNSTGTISQIGPTLSSIIRSTGATSTVIDYSISGALVQVFVRGIVSQTWNWMGSLTYSLIG